MNNKFAYGVDLGWMSQLEEMGYYWTNENGERKDLIDIMKDYGADSVRFRLFVNPPKEGFWDKTETERCMLGYCDTESVLKVSKRAVDAGMRLMLDLHYSDLFCDPQYQQIPKDWAGHGVDELVKDISEYTEKVMLRFRECGIVPEWVQVGNEINPGMLLPIGDSEKAMPTLVRFLNAGYDAVKRIFPETQVITHLASGAVKPWIRDWFDRFFEAGGKTDIIGLSHYPYWYKMMEDAVMTDLGDNMTEYYEKYGKPVMVVEVGEDESKPDECAALLQQTIDDLKRVPGGNGLGIFYWEPEVGKDVLPDRYPLGAAKLAGEKEIRFNGALKKYLHDSTV